MKHEFLKTLVVVALLSLAAFPLQAQSYSID